jgi:hypothetical protein
MTEHKIFKLFLASLHKCYDAKPDCRIGQRRTRYFFRQKFLHTCGVLYNNFCNLTCPQISHFHNMDLATFVPLTASWCTLGNCFLHLHFNFQTFAHPRSCWKVFHSAVWVQNAAKIRYTNTPFRNVCHWSITHVTYTKTRFYKQDNILSRRVYSITSWFISYQ